VAYPRVALPPDERWLAYSFSSAQAEVRVASFDQRVDSMHFTPQTTAPITSLVFSHDGKFVAAATGYPDGSHPTRGGEVTVINVAERTIAATVDIKKRRYESAAINGVSFHPGDPRHNMHRSIGIALDHRPATFIHFSVTGRWSGTCGRHGSMATALAFSSDGYAKATGFADGRVNVEDVCPQDPMPDTDPFEHTKSYVTRAARCNAPVRLLRFLHEYRLLAANDLVIDLRELMHPDSQHRGYWTRREMWAGLQ